MGAKQISQESASVQMGEILDDYLNRAQRGENPSVEEYVQRHPEFADVLRNMLPTLEVMKDPDGLDPTGDMQHRDEIRPQGPLGDFQIVRELGRGGMGVVYEAHQISLGRTVALKVLPFAAAMDERQLQRFKNEAHAAACLHHPHIVPVFGVGCERGVHYYAMQLIEGQSLAAVVDSIQTDRQANEESPKDRPNTQSSSPNPSRDAQSTKAIAALSTAYDTNSREYFRSVAKLGKQAAEALEHAHQSGVIHRDIKPANLILDYRGNLWVTDFGLAQMQSDTRLTMTGDLMGTLRYMSPEQALAKRVTIDHRTDIYSLGSTIYELLSLQPVFAGRDREELLRQIAFEDPKPVRRLNHAIPVELETIVMKAMCKNPAERYQSSLSLAEDLHRFLDDKPIKAKRPTIAQHVSRWTRRHRGVAATIAAGMVLAIIGLGVAVTAIADQKQETENALQQSETLVEELQVQQEKLQQEKAEKQEQLVIATEAETAAKKANEELKKLVLLEQQARKREQEANKKIERNAYLHQMMLADLSRQTGDYSLAERLLSESNSDFRALEWNYLTRKVNDAEWVFRGGATNLPKGATRAFMSPDGRYVAMALQSEPYSLPEFAFLATDTGKPFFRLMPDESIRPRGFSNLQKSIACAYSPDSERAAVALFDDQIAIVDLAEKRELFVLEGHTQNVTCLDFSADGKRLASGSLDKTVRIWDLDRQEAIVVYEDHQQPVRQVAFCPSDSERIVSQAGIYSDDPLLQRFMPAVEANKCFLGCGTNAFDPDLGGFMINNVGPDTPASRAGLQASDVILRVNEQDAGDAWFVSQVLAPFQPGDEVKLSLRRDDRTFDTTITLGKLPDWIAGPQAAGMKIHSAKRQDRLHLWNVKTAQLIAPNVNARDARWSLDGRHLSYVDWNRGRVQIVIADQTGEAVVRQASPPAFYPWARFHPHEQRVLFGIEERIEEWDLETGKMVKRFPISGLTAVFGDYVLGGTHVMAASYGTNALELFDSDEGKLVGQRNISDLGNGGSLLLDQQGQRFVFEFPRQKLSMWNVENWMNRSSDAFDLGLENVYKIVPSNDGKYCAVAQNAPSRLSLFDLKNGKVIHRFSIAGWNLDHLLFNETSTQFACISSEGDTLHHVQVWDLDGFAPIIANGPDEGAVMSAVFRQGKLRTLVSFGADVAVRDAETQTVLAELSLPIPRFRSARNKRIDGLLTADGTRAIVRRMTTNSSLQRRYEIAPIEIWDLQSGECELRYIEEPIGVAGNWISPNGRYMALTRQPNMSFIYDAYTDRESKLDQRTSESMSSLVWSPDEERLLFVGRGSKSPLFDTRTGRQVIVLEHHPSPINATFSDRGKLLMTTYRGAANRFNASPFADDPPRDSQILSGLAWSVVAHPDSGKDEVTQAVQWASEAYERSERSDFYDLILGAAHYRAGNYRAAADLLEKTPSRRLPIEHVVRRLGGLTSVRTASRTAFFLSMARFKLGEKDASMRTFWRTMVSDLDEEVDQSLAKEVAELLGVSIGEKHRVEQRILELSRFSREGKLPNLTRPGSPENAELVLLAYDFSFDGKVTENEIGPQRWEEFKEADQNKDDAIDESELLLRRANARSPRTTTPSKRKPTPEFLLRVIDPIFARNDYDNDGVLTKEDVVPSAWSYLKEHDSDGDGKLGLEEARKSLESKVNGQ